MVVRIRDGVRIAALVACAGCAGDDGSSGSGTQGPTMPGTVSATTAGPTTAGPTTASSGTATETSVTGTATETGATTSGTAPGTTGTSAGTSTGEPSTSNATDPIKLDMGGETGGVECNDMGGQVEFSYIWIANSPDGTVSKIDTETITELGRYQVRPQGGGSPSRTSVSLRGDVAVASRLGGVTKIFARESDCIESNGMNGIQTSSGANDVLPWGTEECVAWYTDFNYMSERAIAWTSGDLNMQTCEYENPKVWVGATNDAVNLEILRLNGDDGTVEDTVQIPGTTGFMSRSPYGGAVDLENDFWLINGYCGASMVEVKFEDLSYEVMQLPDGLCAYGIAIDAQGYVWVGGYQQITGRYDPENQSWDFINAQGLGIQPDQDGTVWLGAYGQNGVYAIDGETLQVLSYTPVPTTGQSKGVAVDFFGYVWIVSDGGTTAIKLDPDTMMFETYTGLNAPYSYSDMTGWGLKNVSIPQ